MKVDDFLSKLSQTLDRVLNKYENIMVIGDMNIDYAAQTTSKFEKLKMFCESFDLENLIRSGTCFQSETPTSIDLILTNKKRSFMNSKSILSGLSDHHAMVTTMFRSHVKRIQPTEIKYRSFKTFNEERFLSDLDGTLQNIAFSEDKKWVSQIHD